MPTQFESRALGSQRLSVTATIGVRFPHSSASRVFPALLISCRIFSVGDHPVSAVEDHLIS
jgi:hypothetical protein